jgi:hypothetical protein
MWMGCPLITHHWPTHWLITHLLLAGVRQDNVAAGVPLFVEDQDEFGLGKLLASCVLKSKYIASADFK